MREKWDEVYYADGSTSGERTIERAVAGISEYCDPEAADTTGGTSVKNFATPGSRISSNSYSQQYEESDSMTEPTETGGAGQRRTHLAEKNRLLTQRVAELETKLEAKEERIAELKAELDSFDTR